MRPYPVVWSSCVVCADSPITTPATTTTTTTTTTVLTMIDSEFPQTGNDASLSLICEVLSNFRVTNTLLFKLIRHPRTSTGGFKCYCFGLCLENRGP